MKQKIQVAVAVAIVVVVYLAVAAFVFREQKDNRVNFQACPLCGQEAEQ